MTMIKHTLAIITAGFICVAQLSQAFEPLDKVLVVVEDSIITQTDYDNRINQVKANLAAQGVNPPADELKQEVLNRLIIEELQLQLAKKSGISISNERLTETMASLAKRNNMTLPQFKQTLEAQGTGYEQMRKQIRNDMMIQTLQQGHLRNKITITEEEVENFLSSPEGEEITKQTYDISHIVLPLSSAEEAQAEKSKQDLLALKEQLLQNPESFNAYVEGQQYLTHNISGANFGAQTKENLPSLFSQYVDQLSDGEISNPIRSGAGWHLIKMHQKIGGNNTEHQVLARHILIKPSKVRTDKQTLALANQLYQQITAEDADFSLLAKEYSEDPGSALQGGDLGWSNTNKFVPAFSNALNALAENQVSKPIQTDFGWHIIQKLGEREHDITKEYWENQAYQKVYERKFDEALETWLAARRNEAFIEYKE